MPEYLINFKNVSKEEFLDFFHSLQAEEKSDNEERPNGGESYRAQDGQGKWYIVKLETNGDQNHSIYLEKGPWPEAEAGK